MFKVKQMLWWGITIQASIALIVVGAVMLLVKRYFYVLVMLFPWYDWNNNEKCLSDKMAKRVIVSCLIKINSYLVFCHLSLTVHFRMWTNSSRWLNLLVGLSFSARWFKFFLAGIEDKLIHHQLDSLNIFLIKTFRMKTHCHALPFPNKHNRKWKTTRKSTTQVHLSRNWCSFHYF